MEITLDQFDVKIERQGSCAMKVTNVKVDVDQATILKAVAEYVEDHVDILGGYFPPEGFDKRSTTVNIYSNGNLLETDVSASVEFNMKTRC